MLTSRSPEVGYLALSKVLGQEHVGGLDVAVREAHLVHVRQTIRRAAAESLHRCRGEQWFTRGFEDCVDVVLGREKATRSTGSMRAGGRRVWGGRVSEPRI